MRALLAITGLSALVFAPAAFADCDSSLPFVNIETTTSVAYTGDEFKFQITPPPNLTVTAVSIEVNGNEALKVPVPALGPGGKHWFKVNFSVGQATAPDGVLKLQPVDTPIVRVKFTDSANACHLSGKVPLNTKDPGVFAVIVGINDYPELGASLRFARQDAEAVAEYLLKNFDGMQADHIMLHTDSKPTALLAKHPEMTWKRATRDDVYKSIIDVKKDIDKAGTIIFYFSGHGYAPDGGGAYLVTEQAGLDFTFKMLRVDDLLDEIRKASVDRTVMLLDACFSQLTVFDDGTVSTSVQRARRALGRVNGQSGLDQLVRAKQVYVLTSSTGTEYSYELDNEQHGAFTYYLLNPDADQHPDPRIANPTLGGVFDSMVIAVHRVVDKRLQSQQTPWDISIGGGGKILWAPRRP